MAQEFIVTFAENNDWKLPLSFAVFLHMAVFFGGIYGPELFHNKPLYPDIYTVDLINIAEPAAEDPAPPPEPAPAPQPEPEPVKKEAVPIVSETPKVEEKIVDTKPVSIKPLKRKKKKKIVKKPDRSKELERIHKRNLEVVKEAQRQADEAARLAEEAAKLATSEAVSKLKDSLRTSTQNSTRKTSKSGQSSKKAGGGGSALESQYIAKVFSRIQPHWKSVEYKVWDPDLSATVIIRIARNGKITKKYFEKKSGDRLFDQFVLKALEDGSPLPEFPRAMKKSSFELGLVFKPGSIN